MTFGVDSSDAAGDPADIGLAVLTAWENMFTWQSDEVDQDGVEVTVGQDGEDPLRQFVPRVGAGVGTSTDDKLPQNCAMLVRKNTALGGRRNRGRFFIPGMLTEEGVNNVGIIGSSDRGAYQGGIDSFFAELTTSTPALPMVILHNTGGVSPIIDPTVVVSLTVDSTISTQRRRLR